MAMELKTPGATHAGGLGIVVAGRVDNPKYSPFETKPQVIRERDDDYPGVVARLNDRWRVIACRDGVQWILQQSKHVGGHSVHWRGRGYCRSRKALIALSARFCGYCDPAALARLASLPEQFRGRP